MGSMTVIWVDSIPLLLESAATMRGLLHAARRDGPAHQIKQLFQQERRLTNLDVVLAADAKTGGIRMRFVPRCLLDALWLQLGHVLQRGSEHRGTFRECQHCGDVFEVGPGTPRRLDAKFCSDAHRIAFNSLRRTKNGTDVAEV